MGDDIMIRRTSAVVHSRKDDNKGRRWVEYRRSRSAGSRSPDLINFTSEERCELVSGVTGSTRRATILTEHCRQRPPQLRRWIPALWQTIQPACFLLL